MEYFEFEEFAVHYVKDIKDKLEVLEDDMLSISLCLPAVLPEGRDVKIYEFINNIIDQVHEYNEEFSEMYDWTVLSAELVVTIENFINNAMVFVQASQQDNIEAINNKYSDLVDNYTHKNRPEVLLSVKNEAYDIFIANLEK